MPYAGLYSLQGAAARDFGTGGRLGTIVGVPLRDAFSFNVEAGFDFLSPAASLDGVHGRIISWSVSPFLHALIGPTEVLVGPKLGFWISDIDVQVGQGSEGSSSAGIALGINAGLMTPASKSFAVGALFNIDLRYATSTGRGDLIGGSPATAPASFAISGAALF